MSVSERVAKSPERMKHFQAIRLEVEITELLCELMENQAVTRAELARRLGTTPPYVTKVLRGQANMTLKTISDLFFALGRSVRVLARPLDVHSPRLLVLEVASGAASSRTNKAYQFKKPTGRREDRCDEDEPRQAGAA